MAITALRKITLGRETNAGTAVATTAVWRGPASTFGELPERVMVNENIGYMVQTDRGYFPTASSALAFPETEATFEQILHVFEAGLHTEASITANGGTSNAYIYNYLPSTTTPLTLKNYTIEAGDEQQCYEQEYSYVREFSLSGAPNQAVMLSSVWPGRQRTKATATAGLTAPTVEEILFNRGTLFMDAVGGTMGGTQITGSWLGFDMTCKTGWTPIYSGDGQLYYTSLKNVGPEITGSITFEYNSNGVAVEDLFAAGTTRLIRHSFAGSATGVTGTGGTYTARRFMYDFAAQITSVDPLDSQDGNDVLKINYKAVYQPTWTKFAEFIVCNLLSAVP